MPIFRCNTYPELNVYIPENGATVSFRRGRLNTDDIDPAIHDAALRRLRSAGECYEDDGTVECPYVDCQQPFASELGLERHLRDLHGGMTPQQLANARAGVQVSLALNGLVDDEDADEADDSVQVVEDEPEEPEPPVRAVRGTRRAVAE